MYALKVAFLCLLFACAATANDLKVNKPDARAIKSLSTWKSSQLLELQLVVRQKGYEGELRWMYAPAYDELKSRRGADDSQLIASLLIYYFGESDTSNIEGELACRRDHEKFMIPLEPRLLGSCRRDLQLNCMLDDKENYQTVVEMLRELNSGATRCWPPRKAQDKKNRVAKTQDRR